MKKNNLLLLLSHKKRGILTLMITLFATLVYSQNLPNIGNDTVKDAMSIRKYSLSTIAIAPPNWFEEEEINTQHIELHFKYDLTSKDKIGIKFATWKLFQPMGITWWDGLLETLDTKSEFYPGRLREIGLGVSYQRLLWKELFATIEVLPQLKTYLDEDNNKIANGFKLYTSYHIGYHIPLFKNRIFIEPQIHCQNWMFDTNTPQGFKELDRKWRTYFLFEPNMYIGVKF